MNPLCLLGVKSAAIWAFKSLAAFEEGPRKRVRGSQPMAPTSLNLAAKVIREGVAYAEGLGFHPDPDFESAKRILADAEPDACEESVPLGGPEDKPFFIQGPHDDAKRIIEHLRRRLGTDGFRFLARIQ